MALPLIVLLCVGVVLCLTPLTIYFLWVASVNRRPQPTAISAGSDFVALMGGLCGLLFLVGILLLVTVQSNSRLMVRGNWEQLQDTWGQERVVWGSVVVGYLLALGGLIAFTLTARAKSLSVYNVTRDHVESIISDVLVSIGLQPTRFGNVWSDGRELVSIQTFNGFHHVTVQYRTHDARLVEELDRGIRIRLLTVPGADSPAGGWFMSLAITCVGAIVACMVLMAYFLYLTRG